jgi:di/tricarboxylate transporter
MIKNLGEDEFGTKKEIELHNMTKHDPQIFQDQDDVPPMEERVKEVEAKIRNYRIMFLLGTAYASNIGGTGVITGSATNIIALELIRKDA